MKKLAALIFSIASLASSAASACISYVETYSFFEVKEAGKVDIVALTDDYIKIKSSEELKVEGAFNVESHEIVREAGGPAVTVSYHITVLRPHTPGKYSIEVQVGDRALNQRVNVNKRPVYRCGPAPRD